jgi:hypothetical protein
VLILAPRSDIENPISEEFTKHFYNYVEEMIANCRNTLMKILGRKYNTWRTYLFNQNNVQRKGNSKRTC